MHDVKKIYDILSVRSSPENIYVQISLYTFGVLAILSIYGIHKGNISKRLYPMG